MLRKILVPTDGSALSEQALPWVQLVAEAQGASIALVRVITSNPVTEFGPNALFDSEIYEGYLEQEAYQYLEGIKDRLLPSGVQVQVHMLHGSPASTLLEYEGELRPDLVVMTSHGRTGLTRFARGSVADRLVREGSAPVLMLQAFSPVPEVIEKALVPLDGSSLGEQALTMVNTLAGRPVQQVRLLRAIEHDDQTEAAKHYLEQVGEGLAERGLGIELDVRVEEASDAIIHAASHMDLVVLCTHGRGGWDRWRHGSVAERVLHGLQAPFLLVRGQSEPGTASTTA